MHVLVFAYMVFVFHTGRQMMNATLSYHTVIITLAFLYQLSSGLSPFFVLVSAMSALPAIKSSCRYVRAKRPVIAVYIGSMTSKSVGKRMSK
jgi:hypothetical protein